MLKRHHTAQQKPAPAQPAPAPQLVWVGQHPRQPLYIYPERNKNQCVVKV